MSDTLARFDNLTRLAKDFGKKIELQNNIISVVFFFDELKYDPKTALK